MTSPRFFGAIYSRLRQSALDGLILLAIFLLSTGAVAYRVDIAPDIFTDEIIYTRMAIRVSGEGALVWDSGQPFLVHPPLYFILQGWLTSLTSGQANPLFSAGNIFAEVTQARLWNAVFAGLTAGLFYLLGVRLHSRKLGLVLAVLFALDPFGVRINRRAMLETLAGMFSLAGILAFLAALEKSDRQRNGSNSIINGYQFAAGFIPAGLLFGAALLSKELTFTTLIALAGYGTWEYLQAVFSRGHRSQLRTWLKHLPVLLPEILVTGLAFLMYSLYPIWVWLEGNWTEFAFQKTLGFKRLIGLVQLSGWNRPGISISDLLLERLQDYGSTYLILALGGASVIGLLIWARDQRGARLLIAWGAVLYPTYAFMAIAGSGNDQLFYFLLLPALVLTSYAAFTLSRLSKLMLNSRFRQKSWFLAGARLVSLSGRVGFLVLLLFVLPYNLFRWWTTFGTGVDNGYFQFTQFVKANVPAGEAINASGDPIKFHYFLPDHQVFAEPTPEEALKLGIHYFALAPKDVQFHFGKIQPELAAWIEQNGQVLFSFAGNSYGKIFLYRVDYPGGSSRSSDLTASGLRWRSFEPAQSGFTDIFSMALFGWIVTWLALANLSGFFLKLTRPAPSANVDKYAGVHIPARKYTPVGVQPAAHLGSQTGE